LREINNTRERMRRGTKQTDCTG